MTIHEGLDLIDCGEHGSHVCVRTGVLGIAFVLTGTAAAVQATRTALVPTDRLRFQLGILIVALMECMVGSVHYIVYSSTVFRFILMYFQLLSGSMVTYHFARLAMRVSGGRGRRLINTVLKPAFALLLVYFTVILCFAAFNRKRRNGESDCDDPLWLTFSISGFVVAVVFCGAAWGIQRRFKHTRVSKNLGRDSRGKKIVMLAAANLISFTLQISLDLFFLAHPGKCGTIYTSRSPGTTILYISTRAVFLFVPVWCILASFSDIPTGASGEVLPAHSVGRNILHISGSSDGHFAGMTTAPLVASDALDTSHQGAGIIGSNRHYHQGSGSYGSPKKMLYAVPSEPV